MVRAERLTPLLEEDPELGRDLGPDELNEATRHLVVPVVEIDPGPWSLPREAFAGLVLDGALAREVVISGHPLAQIVGPGDLIGVLDESPSCVVVVHRFTVLARARVAVLDQRFLNGLRHWPRMTGTALARSAAQLERLAVQQAICQLPRVEERIVALLWTLAERWGRMTPQGVVLNLDLTHELMGRLVGARRPTVSITLKDLAERGAVFRRPDRSWLLGQEPGVSAAPVREAVAA